MRLTAKEAQRIDQQTESFWRQQAEAKIMVRKNQEKSGQEQGFLGAMRLEIVYRSRTTIAASKSAPTS